MKSYKTKKRIGIITRPIDQRTSGSGSHLKSIVSNLLTKINFDEYEVYLIHYERNNLDIYKHSRIEEVIISRNPFIASYQLNKLKLDLIHHSPLTILSPIFSKAKRVATIHGFAPNFLPKQYSLIKKMHEKYAVPFYAKKMNWIFTVSDTTKDYLINKFKLKSNISVTYNSVDDDYKVIEKEKVLDVLAKFSIKGDYLLHISKFSERKNPWTLLNAFIILRERFGYKNKKLVLVGDGWDNGDIKSFVTEHKLDDYVIFTGFVTKLEKIALINGASIFVFPSLYEGFGMPNLEAMACGCPVITSNAFAIPEIVGDAALVLKDKDNAEQLASLAVKLFNNKCLRDKLVSKGYENIGRFSWEKSVQKILNVYDNLL